MNAPGVESVWNGCWGIGCIVEEDVFVEDVVDSSLEVAILDESTSSVLSSGGAMVVMGE